MKVSVNWMQSVAGEVKIMPAGGLDELLQKIGTQLGAVEGVQHLGDKYKGIVIAKVVSCEKHEGADKLSLCKIDDGGKVAGVDRDKDGLVQVVCGAPNVRTGLLVAWLPPGITVPASTDKDPLVLEAREIRGQISNGMLASPHELAISDDHSGILELDPADGRPGDNFVDAFKLDDYIIDIENKMFTHRPDCFGMLGVAREIAGITNQNFSSPEIYTKDISQNDVSGPVVKIVNEIPKLVPRFMVQVFENIKVGPSPFWLQTYLSRVGLRPINNIVDLTNYFMLLTAQPMHAYDYDKVKKLSKDEATIVIRNPQKGEKIKLLNGKEVEPRAEAIMIATDKLAIGIGGVMGGSETEVDDNTKTIILECANFDMFSIRRTSMEHGLFTDAVTRFNKGQSPEQCAQVLNWASDDLVKIFGAKAGSVNESKYEKPTSAQVKVSEQFINDRLGSELKIDEMARLLQNVEFKVEIKNDEMLISAPFWRTDIEIPEDIVEEVGRLFGYDKLPLDLPKRTILPANRNQTIDFKDRIRQKLSRSGSNEVLTYSFVHGDLMTKVGQDPKDAYSLTNAISPDLQHYRLSLIPSLLDKVYPNIRAGYVEFSLFELNQVHNKTHDKGSQLPNEIHSLALVYAADSKTQDTKGVAYFQAKKLLEELLGELNIVAKFENVNESSVYPVAKPFDPKRAALVVNSIDNQAIGIVGEFKASVRRNLKLPKYISGFELSLDTLQKAAISQKQYTTLSKYPSVQQDISLQIPAELTHQIVNDFVAAQLNQHKPANSYTKLETIDIYQPDNDKKYKHITFRLTISSYEKTLKAEEVNALLDEIAQEAHAKLDAKRL